MQLIVNTGSMFSGKSTLLISQAEKHLKNNQRVLVIKPNIDSRYSENEVVTHEGKRIKALVVDADSNVSELVDVFDIDVVLIDEVQFFNREIINSVWWFLYNGIRVYVSGLDLNFLGEGFPVMNELMAMADKVNKLKAVCCNCGADSVVTAKKGVHANMDSCEVIEIGADEKYIPLCRKCYLEYMMNKGEGCE